MGEAEATYPQSCPKPRKERQSEAYQEGIANDMAMYNSLPNDYPQCMDMLKKWRKMDDAEIAEEISMDKKTVKMICAGTNGKLESLAAICLSLQLPPIISNDVIKKSPWSFNLHEQKHLYVYESLQHYYGHKITYIREFLHKYNVDF